MDVYQVCSNKSFKVKIGPAPGVIDFHVYSKKLKKNLVKIKKGRA
jgi:hypothetical protein